MAPVLPPLDSLGSPGLLHSGERRPPIWHDARGIPNLAEWQPGDIVLVRSDGSTVGKIIEGVQSSILSSQPPVGDPDWTHVAIYVDSGLLIESVPGAGVRVQPVLEYARDRSLMVRRLVRGNAALSRTDGESIVSKASEYCQHAYSYWGIARHLLSQTTISHADHFFCSTYVSVVFAQALSVNLESSIRSRPLLPGTSANHPAFVDVPVEWRQPV